eukprot:g7354.t1
MLLPCPLILAASSIICSRSKVTAHNFNLVLLSFARRPILKPKGEDQDKERERRNSRFSDKADIEVDVRSISRSRIKKTHETDSFVDSLWEAIVKTAREKKRQSIFIELDQTADAVMAAQVTKERFRLQVPESLVEKALLAMQPQDDTEDTHQGKVQLTKEAVRNLMYLWQQHGGAASMCFMESHALWAALWAMGLERAYEVHLMGKFFGIFDESGDDCLQYDEFVNFMAHIAPAVPEADCASLFMAVADDTSADMTQEVFLNLVQRVGLLPTLHRCGRGSLDSKFLAVCDGFHLRRTTQLSIGLGIITFSGTASVLRNKPSDKGNHCATTIGPLEAVFCATQADPRLRPERPLVPLGLRVYRCRIVAPPQNATGVKQNVSNPFKPLELVHSAMVEVPKLEPNCLYVVSTVYTPDAAPDFVALRVLTSTCMRFRELSVPESAYFLQAEEQAVPALASYDSFSSQARMWGFWVALLPTACTGLHRGGSPCQG